MPYRITKKTSLFALTFIAITFANKPFAEERTCPQATAFLGKTMNEAKQLLDDKFLSMWNINGPLTTNGYTNLMTNLDGDGICDNPTIIKQIIISGFDDKAKVIGVTYVLPERVETFSATNLSPLLGDGKIVETKEIPSILSPIFKRKEGNQLNLIIEYESPLFIHAGQSANPDNTAVSVFDMGELHIQKNALRKSFEEFGYSE